MSSDVDFIFNNTSELLYSGSQTTNLRENYRLLDAPLTRYTIGISRVIFKQAAIKQDWDWEKTFSENIKAFPNRELLLISRLTVGIFFPFSVVLFFLISKELFKNYRFITLISGFLFAFNSLLLLHSRRAMAESLLIFFLLLSLYSLLILKPKNLWLCSLPIAFAINSKQSLIFLIPVAIIYLIYQNIKNWKKIIFQLMLFFLFLIGISYLLNPIAWKEPVKVAKIMINQRNELSVNQLQAIESVTPEFTTTNLNKRLTAFIAQVFVLRPSLQDIGNYEEDLHPSFNNYLNNPLHIGIFRNLFFGVILILLTLFGFLRSFFRFSKKKIIIFSISFLFIFTETLFFINIPFQRYYLPAIPFTIIFSIFGAEQMLTIVKDHFQKMKTIV